MARKTKSKTKTNIGEINEAHITSTDVAEVLETNYMPYTMSVIVSRALPEVDGLKPAHRKLLYTMYKMGLLKGNKTKSANIVGTTMRLNPHGDCLRGDTKIYLANNEIKTIKELYEENTIQNVLVVNKAGKVQIAQAHSFRIGQYTDTIYKVHLSDGSFIEVTGNHPFLAQDKRWVKAEKLSVFTRLFTSKIDVNKLNDRPIDPTTIKVEKHKAIKVTRVDAIKVEKEPMYDFTVTDHENMLVVTSTKDNKINTICVHNSSIYDTMVRIARGNESLLHPYVDSKGNFGKVYSKDSAAASRYTEAKLEKIMEEFFRDIDSNAVEFVDNYDSTTKEPLLLPVTFPSILVNPNMGIAVGMASNICSFNLEEICNATIEIINEQIVKKAPVVTTARLMEIVKSPDFSTGGNIVYNEEIIKQIYETGRGTVYLTGKHKYNEKLNRIEIYEIPYTTTVDAIIDSITDLVKNNQIKELTDIRDATGKDGMAIHLDLKRNVNHEQLMAKLYMLTPLKSSFSCNFNIILNGHPLTLGIKDILIHWIEFRAECIRRRTESELLKNKHKLHMLEALEKVLLDLDQAVKIVKDTPKEKDVITNLMNHFKIDDEQANYVAEIKLKNFNREYILNRTKARKDTEKEIKKLEGILGSEVKTKRIIVSDLEDVIKKYAQPRKTQIISEKKIKAITTEDLLVDDYNVKLYVSNEGYVKKVALTSMRGAGDNKTKEGDFISQEIDTTNKSDILFFTNKRTVYKIKTHELEDSKLSQLGTYIPNIVKLEDGEEVIYVVSTVDYTGSMLFFFENGKCARVGMKGYETKTNRKQLINAYSKASELVRAIYVPEDEDIDVVLVSSIDKVLLVNTSRINVNNTKSSQGVGVMKGAKSDKDFKVVQISLPEEVNLTDDKYYRTTGSTAAVGKFLKKEDTIRS